MKRLFLYLATALLLTFPFPSVAAETPEDILDLFRPGMSRAEARERAKGASISEAGGALRFRLDWASRTWDVTLRLRGGKTVLVRWTTDLDRKTARELRRLLRKRDFVPAWYQETKSTDFLRLARQGMDEEARLRLFDERLDALIAAGDAMGMAVLLPASVFRECAGRDYAHITEILDRHQEEIFVLAVDKRKGRLTFMTAPDTPRRGEVQPSLNRLLQNRFFPAGGAAQGKSGFARAAIERG